MDEESHSTSQDSSNSREAIQMNTSVPLRIVNLHEAHCVLCRPIDSLDDETIWLDDHHICQDCEVLIEEETRQFFEESHQRVQVARQLFEESHLQRLQEARQLVEEARQHVNLQEAHCVLCRPIDLLDDETIWLDDHHICQDCEVLFEEETRQFFEESHQRVQVARQLFEESHPQRLQEARQLFEEARQHVNLQEAHCVLCRPIDLSDDETIWLDDLNICQDCEVFFVEETRQSFEESEQRIQEAWRLIEESEQRFQEALAEEAWQHVEPQMSSEEDRLRFVESMQLLGQRIGELAGISISREEPALLPTTLSFVDSLPRVIITEEHTGLECTICLDPLSIGSIVNQLPCLHFYHPLCIVPWLKVSRSCPTCRYKLSSAFRTETRQNSNRRMGFQEIVQEGFSVNSSSATSNVNEPEVVVSESHNETPDTSARDREGSRGGWFLFAAAPIVSLVGIALVECFQNFLGDGRGRGSTGHVEFRRQCQQQVRMFSSGSSSTRTSNSRETT